MANGNHLQEDGRGDRFASRRLLAKAELRERLLIELGVLASQVPLEPTAPTHEHQQAAPRVVIVFVGTQVFGKLGNPARQQCDLDRRRSDIALPGGEFSDRLGFLFGSRQLFLDG
jgi:hypothetical protein